MPDRSPVSEALPPKPLPLWLGDFAARAATIDERLSDLFEPSGEDESEPALERLAAWCRAAASGDGVLFEKRLRIDGLSTAGVLPRLGAVRLRSGAPPPQWALDAAWIVAAMRGSEGGDPLAGIVAATEERRDGAMPPHAPQRFAPAARSAMREQLRRELTRLRGDLTLTAALVDEKPVLVRLLASAARQWIETTAEFMHRLDADVDDLSARLLGGTAPGPVVSLESGLSDPHNFGRSVLIARFDNGSAVVYKPKDLAVDAQWAALLDWLNARDAPIDLRAVRVVQRDGYGWCEFVEHGDCPDRAAVERFFQRGAALLCLGYLLVGTDLHEENVIAVGEHPVVIDQEMLFQARDSGSERPSAMRAQLKAQQRVEESVLTVGLLPAFVMTPQTAMIAQGGLFAEKSDGGAASDNLPQLEGRTPHLAEYAGVFMEACEEYMHFLAAQKEALLAADGPLSGSSGCTVRRVLHPTRFYYLLNERLRNPREMDDGARWSSQIDFIARLADWDDPRDPSWQFARAERLALAVLNIPFFVHGAGGTTVRDGAGTIEVGGFDSGLERARRRIAAFDANDIAWQLRLVRLTVRNGAQGADVAPLLRRFPREHAPLTREEAFSWTDRIARQIAACALEEDDGVAWIGLDPLSDLGGWAVTALGSDLYGGNPGIALFLAAHARMRQAPASRALAYQALAGLRHALAADGATTFARVVGLGGAAGMGSIVYTLTVLAELLEAPELYDDARRAVALLDDSIIAGDTMFDTIAGAAGGILGLLKLHRAIGDENALERAVACGRHLLLKRPADGQLWRHISPVALTGFSHGAAGFAYGFAALAAASGIEEFASAARECIAYEDATFSAERSNWPDLRDAEALESPGWPAQWCHGAAGIGLARLGMLRFGKLGLDFARDIEAAIVAVRARGPIGLDSLCCGNLGSGEFLNEAGRVLGRSELFELAARRLAGVTAAAETNGSFGWHAGTDEENLGFFRGLAGIGYTLLRYAAPGVLPNVLIWE